MIPNSKSHYGKGKIYSENSCYKKSCPESLADENKVSDKSDKFINDASLNALLEIENLGLKNVNKIINGNINIKSLSNKFEQLKELVMKQ